MMRRLINWTGYLPKPDSYLSRVVVARSTTVISQTNLGTSGVNVADTGVDWANPGNAVGADDQYASAILNGASPLSDYLRVTGFGFTVSGVIVGIIAALLRRNTGFPASGIISNISTRLVLNGVPLAEKVSGALYPASRETELLGGSSDLWGATFTPAQINDPLFGVETKAQYDIGGANCTAQVDRMALTVYYIP